MARALGDQSLDGAQIEDLREALRRSGALQRTEQIVDELSQRTEQALAQMRIEDLPRAGLQQMADALVRRSR